MKIYKNGKINSELIEKIIRDNDPYLDAFAKIKVNPLDKMHQVWIKPIDRRGIILDQLKFHIHEYGITHPGELANLAIDAYFLGMEKMRELAREDPSIIFRNERV